MKAIKLTHKVYKDINFREESSKYTPEQIFNYRAIFLMCIVFICLSLLIARLFFLQVIDHDDFTARADRNRIKIIPVPPSRGLIYDRNGVILADSTLSYNLTITRQDITRPIQEIIADLQKIIPISEQNITRFMQLLKVSTRQNPVILRDQLSENEINRLAVDLYQFAGVDITPQATRFYPFKEIAVHAIGYVGRIDKNNLISISQKNLNNQYIGITHIGKRGAEASYEDLLRGEMGSEQVETNVSGRVVRKINHIPPVAGKHIYLSIDIRLQQYAEKALGNNNGAIVAIDPKTGEILAFVSKPIFDPNLFVNGIDTKTFNTLNRDPNFPFLNRVMRGGYPPGSVIKPHIGIAGLELGFTTLNKTVYCPGWYSVPNSTHRFRDWKKSGHGHVNLAKAIQTSCDVYFYDLAFNMGIEPMTDFLKKFSLGAPTGIDLKGELSGTSPTPDYKRRTFKQPWYPGDTVTAGIGQSYWISTPLQIAQSIAIISMKGQAFKPKMLHATRHPDERTTTVNPPTPITPIILKDPKHWDHIIASMISVVHNKNGTAHRLSKGINYKIAGKTGTAQVKSIAQGASYNAKKLERRHHDHAWFTGFAPAHDPKIAIAVLVENGGSGSNVAGPIAKNIMNAWLTEFNTPPKNLLAPFDS